MEKILMIYFLVLIPLVSAQLYQSGETPITLSVFEPNVCGNRVCEMGEDCSNCPQDCGVCPTPPPGGGVGPGIYIPPPNISVSPYNLSITLKNFSSFIPVYVEIPSEKNLSIIAMIIETKTNLSELNLTIERIFEKPAYINSSSENDYTYLQILSNSQDIFRLKFKFKVEKNWFKERGISNFSQITMFKFKESFWERLFTLTIHEDSDYYYYYSECWGLSLFSIGTYKEEEAVVQIPSCPLCPPDTDWTACVNNEQSRIRYICGNETGYVCLPIVEKRDCRVEKAFDLTFVYFGVIIALAVVLVGVFARQKITFKPIKLPKPKPPKPKEEEKTRILKPEEALKEKVIEEVKPEKVPKPIEVPKVEVKPEIPKLAIPKKIKVKKIEDIVKKFNVGDTIRVKADVALHAIGIPNIYKLEDDSAVIYGSYDKLIDRGTYWVEAIVKEEDGRKYLEIKEVKNV